MGPLYCYDTCLNLAFPLRGVLVGGGNKRPGQGRRVQAAAPRQAAPPLAAACGKSIFGLLFQAETHKNVFRDLHPLRLVAQISAFDIGTESLETKTALMKILLYPHCFWKNKDLGKQVVWNLFHGITGC